MWDRSEGSTFNANAFGAPTALTIFDPTTVVAGNQDLRLTVRAIHVEAFWTVTFSASVAQGLIAGFGVFMGPSDATATLPDPLLPTAFDQREDWLYLAHNGISIAGGAIIVFGGPNIGGSASADVRGSSFHALAPRIRAQRKLDQDQVIRAVFNLKRLDAATFAAPTQTRSGLIADASVLYSRTRR